MIGIINSQAKKYKDQAERIDKTTKTIKALSFVSECLHIVQLSSESLTPEYQAYFQFMLLDRLLRYSEISRNYVKEGGYFKPYDPKGHVHDVPGIGRMHLTKNEFVFNHNKTKMTESLGKLDAAQELSIAYLKNLILKTKNK